MSEKTEAMEVEAGYNCLRCGVDGEGVLLVVVKKPFTTDSGRYKLTYKVECENCGKKMDLSDDEVLDDIAYNPDKLLDKIDEKFSEKYV